jgi:hypothetical protein
MTEKTTTNDPAYDVIATEVTTVEAVDLVKVSDLTTVPVTGIAGNVLFNVVEEDVQTTTVGVARELAVVRDAVAKDPDLLWAWHCNLTMAAMDSGARRDVAMNTSQRFLSSLFQVDVSADSRFQADMKDFLEFIHGQIS